MSIRSVSVPVDGRVPGGATNAYLVDGGLLVDPAASTARLDDALAAATVEHVAATHTHPDHVGALADVAARTDATVWAHHDHVDRFVSATGVAPDRTFGDGTTIPVGDGVTVLETPGHAPDHVAFALDAGVLCGDLAVAEGSVAVAAPDGEMDAYLASLRALRARDPPRLDPGHGPPIDAPAATLDRLYEHRLDRERRVLDAVEGGARDPDAVVERAYDADLTDYYDLARRSVVAHLEKLAAEGHLVWDPARERVDPR